MAKKHKPINKARIKILLKNGYHELDMHSQTLIKPDGTIELIPQWDIDYYMSLHKWQTMRGVGK